MMRAWMALAAAGVLAGAWACAASSPSMDSYAKVEAASLVRSPQNSWARAILFTDVLKTPPDGRTKRLGRTEYREMRLETAGPVWVPADLADRFKALQVGGIYSFAGTVDQISRRYYIIVDACFTIQTTADLKEHWTDMLNPPARPAAGDITETAMQALLVDAQNRLIAMAKENNTTVADLIEMQTDGGQRIAANIVADALAGELRAQNKTAEELMIGAVLALLQKQSVLEESAKIGEELAASAEAAAAAPESASQEPAVPLPEEAPAGAAPEPVAAAEELPSGEVEAGAAVPEAVAEVPAEELAPVMPEEAAIPSEAGPGPVAATEAAMPAQPEEEMAMAEVPAEEPAPVMPEEAAPAAEPETTVEDLLAGLVDEEEALPEAQIEEGIAPETMVEAWVEEAEALEPGAAEAPEIQTGEEQPVAEGPAAGIPEAEPSARPSSSRAVVPLTREEPEIVPMVSVRPTKAELAQRKKREAQAQRDAQRQAQKALAAEKTRKREEARQAELEAKRIAAAEKKAAAEARQAKLEEQKQMAAQAKREAGEKQQADLAARKAAAAKAKAEAMAREEAEAGTQAEAAAAAVPAAEEAGTTPAEAIDSGKVPEWMQPVFF